VAASEKNASDILNKATAASTEGKSFRTDSDDENPVVISNAAIVPSSTVLSEVDLLKAKVAALEQASGMNDSREVWFRQWKADYAAGSITTKIYLVLRFIM
jgi:hypothetical protein